MHTYCENIFKDADDHVVNVHVFCPQANAEYIKLADNFILVPGGSNNHNYANITLILDIARRIPVQVLLQVVHGIEPAQDCAGSRTLGV